MKKFTKAIATLCAMAMVVSVFSATVLAEELNADEEAAGEEAAAEEAIPEEQEAEQKSTVVELPFVKDEELNDQNQDQKKAPDTRSATISIDQDYIDTYGLPTTTGDYVLVSDVEVAYGVQVTTTEQNITIDLAGYNIVYSGSESLYVLGYVDGTNIIATNVTLTVTDSVGGGSIKTSSSYVGGGSDDHWVSTDGQNPTSGVDTGRGGCILVQIGSKFILEGGIIDGFKSKDDGGAVHVSNGGAFEMRGGVIQNCTAATTKNGSSDRGGGAVAGHCASKGASVKINGETVNLKGSVKLLGGTITHNYAYCGGGVRILRGDIEIKDITITENYCVSYGGGLAITKGHNTTTQTISGNPQIFGNTYKNNSNSSNLYLASGTTISLDGNLNSTAKIGIESGNTATSVNLIKLSGNTCEASNFTSDKSKYYVVLTSSYVTIHLVAPKIEGYSLTIGGEIVLNVQISLGKYDVDDATVTYSYEYTKGTTTQNINKTAALKSSNNGNYTYMIPVESACMTAGITVTVDYGEGSIAGNSVTIESYANSIISKGNAQQKAVAEALLIYGGYAQVQFNINTDKLPAINDIDFTSDEASFGLPAAAYTDISDPDNAFAGAKLSMLSQTEIKLYFKKSAFEGDAPEMTVSYSDETIEATSSGNYYVYVIKGPSGNGFSATQYDQTFTYSVGNVTGTYSVYTYLKVAKNSSTNQAMVNLAEAYYNFAEKCKLL